MKRLAAIILTPIILVLLATGVNILVNGEGEPAAKTEPLPLGTYVDTKPSIQDMVSKITPDALYVAINKERVANNLTPYSRNNLLDKSSQAKCDDMVKNNYYGHKNPTTGQLGNTYVNQIYGYHDGSSENLTEGYFADADSVIKGWMDSTAHRASIIDPKYKEIGFAVCIKADTPNELTVVQHKAAPIATNVAAPSQRIDASSWLPKQTKCTYTEPSEVAGVKFDGRISCSTN